MAANNDNRTNTGTISRSSSQSKSTYTSVGWSEKNWTFNGVPIVRRGHVITFEGERTGRVVTGSITRPQSLIGATYSSKSWNMESIWFAEEGVKPPVLIRRNDKNEFGIPLTHYMNYVHVVPHVNGTAVYLETTWKYIQRFYVHPLPYAKGVVGQKIRYEVGNLEHRIYDPHQQKDIDVIWIFSGVMDFDGPGGYAFYSDEKVREVVVHAERAAVAQFYFVEPRFLPRSNFKLKVSTPEGILEASTSNKPYHSPIRFVADDGEIWSIPVVELDDEEALATHVVSGGQVKAFQKYIAFTGIRMLEGDDMIGDTDGGGA